MRRTAILIASGLLFFGYAARASAVIVTYEYPTSGELSCPANSTLNGTMCYCNVGYNMSGGLCVKIEAPTPTEFQIYEDVLMSVTVNDTMTCDQLGIFAATDKDMCQRYKATSRDARDKWKSIPRPSISVGGIATPWAPITHQTFDASQAVAPIKPAPPPVATSSAATSTPKVVPPDAPVKVADDEAATEKMGEALKKVLDDRQKKSAAPASSSGVPQDTATSSPAPAADSGPSSALIELSKKMAADAAAAAAEPPPAVTPTPSASSANTTQTAQAAHAVEPESSPGFFSRIIGFFRWLF